MNNIMDMKFQLTIDRSRRFDKLFDGFPSLLCRPVYCVRLIINDTMTLGSLGLFLEELEFYYHRIVSMRIKVKSHYPFNSCGFAIGSATINRLITARITNHYGDGFVKIIICSPFHLLYKYRWLFVVLGE